MIEWLAAECGVCETVMIAARTIITRQDWIAGRSWPDAVCHGFYSIDVHEEDGVIYEPLPRGVVPTIPYGAMLPRRGQGILAAGRCIGGDRMAFSAYRVQATCMATGQAAGAAAALAVQSGCDVADVRLDELRQTLARHGAIVPPGA